MADRSKGYALDGMAEDLRRLLAIAELSEDMTRRGLARVGITSGWRALDCGCGPLGALPILADLVGDEGHVVGADSNPGAIDRAAATLQALDIAGVQLVTADARALDADLVGGPLDVIYTRCFLMHQSDVGATLRHLAGLLRPGGWLVCHEPLPVPRPWAHPDHHALQDAWDLLHTVMRASGAATDGVPDLAATAADAGFVVIHAGSTSTLMPPALGFELHAQTIDASRARAEAVLPAIIPRLDAVSAQLHAAAIDDRYKWVSTPLYLDFTARLS
jgi:ubiquinone/menaquinone biosynthesis C-methylase UbiE